MSQKLVLIDGHSILNRAFYGLPDMTTQSGLHTNAVLGFLNIMLRILDEEKPDYLVVAFDVSKKTFRHEMYEAYKGTRKGMPEELREQVPVMKDVLHAMEILTIECPGFEADDVLGTLAKQAARDGLEVSLVSGDRDLLQIADEHIKIRIPKTKMGHTTIEDYYATDVIEKMHVTPVQFIDEKALMGDTSDNIPGVPKIGAKTAEELIATYGSLDGIYEHIDEISKKAIRESLIENKEIAYLCKALATIKIDCSLEESYENGKIGSLFNGNSYEWFQKLEFRSLLNKYQFEDKGREQKEISFELMDTLEELKHVIEQSFQTVLALFPIMEGKDCIGVSLSTCENKAFLFMDANYVHSAELLELLHELSVSYPIVTFRIKEQYDYLQQDSTDSYFDILIAAYLCNPLKNDYDMESICSGYLGEIMQTYEELFGKNTKTMAYLSDPTKFMTYYSTCAVNTFRAYDVLKEKLTKLKMDQLMKEIEMPLTLVLYSMEREGIIAKREKLAAYGESLKTRIAELETLIFQLSGEEFNILSPKQLAVILFEKMQLPGGKKTKTGYSTAADVLEKLAPEHEIVRFVLEYRGLCKLKSTYADGLAEYIGEDGRIHTSFQQTITATGRISSTEPNLQNIPMRMELGRSIRKVFVPRMGCVFLDADYSQIELRILAHMSGDKQLIEAYKTGQDIHRMTASKVFHVPFEEVTDLQRRNAKAVNFGIVYGISAFGLSQDLDISPKEAAGYIEQYFATYPGIKSFLDSLVAEAKEQGYITTLFGRRRPIPELQSSNFVQRSFGERVAMNSPIQGTAADIMKIAMIHVWKELRERGLQSKMILQIHDELLIETVIEELDVVEEILVKGMKEAANLSVALEVEAHQGNDWYEAK